MSESAPAGASRRRWRALVLRGLSYSVCSALAALLLSAILPPILADVTDRAVVSAPIALLTAPIAGEVQGLTTSPGEPLQGQRLAWVRNDRIDRSTLIGLENQVAGARLQLTALQGRRRVLTAHGAALGDEIQTHRTHLRRHLATMEAEARARAAAALAVLGEISQLARRQASLLARGVVSPEAAELAARREAAAREEAAAASAVLARRTAEREAAESGAFVGEGLMAMASLAEKRRDVTLELARAGIEETQAAATLTMLEASAAAEAARLARLAEAEVLAPPQGVVLKLDLAAGRQVQAGDTVATAVDCRRAFVAAIFSLRQASRLAVGTRVDLAAHQGGEEAGSGTVVQILPRTTERVDQGYAVPFPPIERREMYVLIEADAPAGQAGETPCGLGRWMTVTLRGGGLVGKGAELWREAYVRARNAVFPVARAAMR